MHVQLVIFSSLNDLVLLQKTIYSVWDILHQLPSVLLVQISVPTLSEPPKSLEEMNLPGPPHDSNVRFTTLSWHEVYNNPDVSGFGRHLSPGCGCFRTTYTRFGGRWYDSKRDIQEEMQHCTDSLNEELEQEEQVWMRDKCTEHREEWGRLIRDEEKCAALEDWHQV